MIPSLDLSLVGKSSDVSGNINATELLKSLDQDEKLPDSAKDELRTFTGNFGQLSKCEMGTAPFKQKIEGLPKAFLMLAAAMSGPSVKTVVLGRDYGNFRVWLTQNKIDANTVNRLLLEYDTIFLEGSKEEKKQLGRDLITYFLRPCLEVLK